MPSPSGTLKPYSGPWTFSTAAHLLRRTSFGPTRKMIQKAESIGLQSCINELFIPNRFPEKPLNHNYANEPNVPIGNTWVDIAPPSGANQYRVYSINAWYINKLQSEEFNILQKLVLFWHNHFVVAEIENPQLFYTYFDLLQKFSLGYTNNNGIFVPGSFKDLTKAITINAGMLRYLNGNTNTKLALNENFGRELLELFTIGKGPLVAPGDYTTFTEQDVRAIAKALTGWAYGAFPFTPVFDASKHEPTSKQLSHRFNNTSISNLGDQEYLKVIDIIFQQDECSRFIARELYKWFCNYHLSPEVERDVIEPMAQMIRTDNYNIINALKTLLSSEHFFSDEAFGCVIKAPLDFLMSISNALKFPVPSGLNDKYTYFNYVWINTKLMGQTISEHPDVAGWKAYYQDPLYYRHWINGVSLRERKRWIDLYVNKGITVNTLLNIKIPVLEIVKEFEEPSSIDRLIADLSDLLFTHQLTKSQFAIAKDVILRGLPSYEWTEEYEDYAMNPNDQQKRDAIENKLRALFTHLMNLPEFLLH